MSSSIAMPSLWSLLSDSENYILKFVLSELESRLGGMGQLFFRWSVR